MAHPLADPTIEVTTDQVADQLAAGEVQVVDVREGYEREAGHIEGTRHVELERLASQSDSIPKDRPVVFYCRLGARSAMAAQAFRASGYEAYSMAGGLKRWDDEGLPVAGGGTVADH